MSNNKIHFITGKVKRVLSVLLTLGLILYSYKTTLAEQADNNVSNGIQFRGVVVEDIAGFQGYNLTTSVQGDHGTISASKTGLAENDTETVTFMPDAGYEINAVTVNGNLIADRSQFAGNKLDLTMDGNKDVVVSYRPAPITYDLTTSVQGDHGTISASKTGLAENTTETVTFMPEAGYEINAVTVNGTPVDPAQLAGNQLDLTMDGNKEVVVSYKLLPITYDLTTSVQGDHGTISASKTGLAENATETVTFMPDAGYEIAVVTVNGTPVDPAQLAGNQLDLTMDGNKEVVVSYRMFVKQSANGSIDESINKADKLNKDNNSNKANNVNNLSKVTTNPKTGDSIIFVIYATIMLMAAATLYITRRNLTK